MKNLLIYISTLLISPLLLHANQVIESASPDGSIQCRLFIQDGRIHFSFSRLKQLILEDAMLDFTVNHQPYASSISKFRKVKDKIHREEFQTKGTHSNGVNWYREIHINAASGKAKNFLLLVRLYNTGMAYRYQFFSKDSCSVDEQSQFQFPSGTGLWMQNDIQYYEGMYYRQLADSVKAGKKIGPPLVSAYGNDQFAALTEVDLNDYAGMALKAIGHRKFQTLLSGDTRRKGTIQSPWRLIMAGNLNELVNNDFMANLSPKPDPVLFKNADQWIRPGLSVWSWLTDYNVASKYIVGFEDMKKFSKWAGEIGIPYNLVDDGWSNWKQGDKDHWALMKELVEYSAEQGVKVWLWKAYPDFKGIEGINSPEKMKIFFRKCAEVGVVGVKIDFFNNESQEINRFYRAALEEAAKYKIMVNFHGSNKPTGLQHQYPNEMAREGIQGNEYGPDSRRAVVLPFTRLLVGSGDYTPLILSKDNTSDTSWRQRYHKEMTGGASWSFQIATTLLFSSPILCLSASPTDIIASGQQDFIKNIPVEWDETIVLPPSEIGERVLMARRKGTDWFLICVSEKPVDKMEVPLDFLSEGDYNALLLADDPNTVTALVETRRKVDSRQKLSLTIRGKGGFVARFTK